MLSGGLEISFWDFSVVFGENANDWGVTWCPPTATLHFSKLIDCLQKSLLPSSVFDGQLKPQVRSMSGWFFTKTKKQANKQNEKHSYMNTRTEEYRHITYTSKILHYTHCLTKKTLQLIIWVVIYCPMVIIYDILIYDILILLIEWYTKILILK